MNPDRLRALLERVARGELDADAAFEAVKHQVLASLDRSLNRVMRPADDLLTVGEGI